MLPYHSDILKPGGKWFVILLSSVDYVFPFSKPAAGTTCRPFDKCQPISLSYSIRMLCRTTNFGNSVDALRWISHCRTVLFETKGAAFCRATVAKILSRSLASYLLYSSHCLRLCLYCMLFVGSIHSPLVLCFACHLLLRHLCCCSQAQSSTAGSSPRGSSHSRRATDCLIGWFVGWLYWRYWFHEHDIVLRVKVRPEIIGYAASNVFKPPMIGARVR